ncbi:MAG: S8 family serine peptidase [Candidatus Aminicenantes bacterium]|nr:S8 family serine peptidase [Candidatus Aminicenantes bacterium]
MRPFEKAIWTVAFLLFASAFVFAGGPKRRALIDRAAAPKPYAEGEVIVKFRKGLDLTAVQNFAAAQSLNVKKRFKVLTQAKGQIYVLLSSPGKVDTLTLVNALKDSPQVESVSPNYRREMCATPNDPRFGELWGLHNASDHDINAPAAWDTSTGSSSVIVAVIDSGLDYAHPDLAPNAWTNPGEIAGNDRDDDGNGYIDDVHGIDPAGADGSGDSPDTDPMDGIGHGSHCAGTIGARGNNSIGVVGVNWNVKIMALKFFGDYDGGGWDDDAIECMEYAIWEKLYHGQNVVAINASWGSTGGSDTGALRDAIEVVNDAGIVFCAAAGNGGPDGIGDNNEATHHYPSDYTLPGIISVMATDNTDTRASFSNYGVTSVDLAAPGVGILSTIPAIYVPQAGDIFFDNVEGGSGSWIHGAISGSDYWQITTDQEGFANPSFPVPSPTHFWSDRPGSNYANNSNTWLAYNADINLTAYQGQKIYFGIGSAVAMEVSDHAYVEFSSNGGESWTVIHDFTDEGWYWSNWSWLIPESFKTTRFRMRFRLTSNNRTNWIGWLIDNIGIGYTNVYYDSWNGTSMATPHVAGAVALMASEFPSETVSQRKKRILDNAESIGSLSGYCVTGARLDLEAAIEASTPTPDPAIRVTSPNGGESWIVGSTHSIIWTSEGTVGNVNLHYSTNGGGSWNTIATNESNDGDYSWVVPNAPSANCRISVQENDGTPSDMSDMNFSIVDSGTESVSPPSQINGPVTGSVGQHLFYVAGGSESTWSDPVQYYFDWGDGNNSGWLAVGTTTASHSWSSAGTFNVRARARCSIHTAIVSAYSANFPVIIYDEPTWVGITRFGACAGDGQPTVEWHTAAEVGPAGFHLWRLDARSREYERVNPSFLPALVNSPQGGVYRLADPGAMLGEPVVYLLEEVDAQGRTRSYGPFTVTFGGVTWPRPEDVQAKIGREEPTGVDGYRRFERGRSAFETERLSARRQEQRRSEPQAAANRERARISVRGRGLFYVPTAQVARALGQSEGALANIVLRKGLNLTSMGKDVAWEPDAGGAGIFFYNEGLETVYSDTNVFWLERGGGLAMETIGGGNAGPADPGQAFGERLHFEENRHALTALFSEGDADIWLWDYVVAGGEGKTFAIEVPAPAGTGTATLTVHLHGATDTAADEDHHAIVSLNGTKIGEATWDGTASHVFEMSFSPSLLREGANTLKVSGALDMGAPHSVFYVESFDLGYQRHYRALANVLICRGDYNRVVTIGGFTEPDVVALDVSDAARPKRLTGVAPDVSGRVTFVPRAVGNTYLVCGLRAALRPLSVVGDRPASLKGAGHSAEYIVIAPQELENSAQELADYRQRQGLKSAVVTLEDIYEVFDFGLPSPLAVRDFLAHAYSRWGGKKVKYAVLAGKGTYDYKNYLGCGDNLVPVILAATPEGLVAADREFGDVTGRNGLPEIAVGRLPAVTNEELRAMITKIKAYEGGQGAWTDRALFIADDADGGGDFARSCDSLAALAAGFQAEKIYLNGSAQETRDRIIAGWNAGAGLLAYCGHGALNQLAKENIFHVSDAVGLRNGDRLPLAMMLTCVAGRFELPGFTSLGEALMLNRNGGMAGGLLPSGAALNADSLRLGEAFYRELLRGGGATTGQALVKAMKVYLQAAGPACVLNMYNWLGDPALKAK